MLHIPFLYISDSPKGGRGMFVADAVPAGTTIEVFPYIIIPKDQVAIIHKTVLHDYYFLLPDDSGAACIALGYGGIYNHSSNPNAVIIFDIEAGMMEIEAIREIEAGEEVTFDYTDNQIDAQGIWFEEK